MSKRSGDNPLVYSSERGQFCPHCSQVISSCTCKRSLPAAKPARVVTVGRETSGRKGKGVTVVRGVALPPADLAVLATVLKQRCASGGTVKDGVIEIQGDHRDRIVDELQGRGWLVKRSGG